MQLVVFALRRMFAHSQVRILTGFLQIKQSREHNRIPLGGHAAVVVDSGVERDAFRQQPLSSTLQTHTPFIQRKEGPELRPLR